MGPGKTEMRSTCWVFTSTVNCTWSVPLMAFWSKYAMSSLPSAVTTREGSPNFLMTLSRRACPGSMPCQGLATTGAAARSTATRVRVFMSPACSGFVRVVSSAHRLVFPTRALLPPHASASDRSDACSRPLAPDPHVRPRPAWCRRGGGSSRPGELQGLPSGGLCRLEAVQACPGRGFAQPGATEGRPLPVLPCAGPGLPGRVACHVRDVPRRRSVLLALLCDEGRGAGAAGGPRGPVGEGVPHLSRRLVPVTQALQLRRVPQGHRPLVR